MRFGGGNLALAHRLFLLVGEARVVVAVVALPLRRGSIGKTAAVAEVGARPSLIVLTLRAVLSALVPVHVDSAKRELAVGVLEVDLNRGHSGRVDLAGHTGRHIRASLRQPSRIQLRHIRGILEAREIEDFSRRLVSGNVAHNAVQRARCFRAIAWVVLGVSGVTGHGRKAERGLEQREHRGEGYSCREDLRGTWRIEMADRDGVRSRNYFRE